LVNVTVIVAECFPTVTVPKFVLLEKDTPIGEVFPAVISWVEVDRLGSRKRKRPIHGVLVDVVGYWTVPVVRTFGARSPKNNAESVWDFVAVYPIVCPSVQLVPET